MDVPEPFCHQKRDNKSNDRKQSVGSKSFVLMTQGTIRQSNKHPRGLVTLCLRLSGNGWEAVGEVRPLVFPSSTPHWSPPCGPMLCSSLSTVSYCVASAARASTLGSAATSHHCRAESRERLGLVPQLGATQVAEG